MYPHIQVLLASYAHMHPTLWNRTFAWCWRQMKRKCKRMDRWSLVPVISWNCSKEISNIHNLASYWSIETTHSQGRALVLDRALPAPFFRPSNTSTFFKLLPPRVFIMGARYIILVRRHYYLISLVKAESFVCENLTRPFLVAISKTWNGFCSSRTL